MNETQKSFFYFSSRIFFSILGGITIYLLVCFNVQSTKGIILGLVTFSSLFILAIFLFIKSIDGLIDFEIDRYNNFLSNITPTNVQLLGDISIEQILKEKKFKLKNGYYTKAVSTIMFGKFHFYAKVVNLLPSNNAFDVVNKELSRVKKVCSQGRNCLLIFLIDEKNTSSHLREVVSSALKSALVSFVSMETSSIESVPVLICDNKASFIDTNGKHTIILSDYDRGCKMLNKIFKNY